MDLGLAGRAQIGNFFIDVWRATEKVPLVARHPGLQLDRLSSARARR